MVCLFGMTWPRRSILAGPHETLLILVEKGVDGRLDPLGRFVGACGDLTLQTGNFGRSLDRFGCTDHRGSRLQKLTDGNPRHGNSRYDGNPWRMSSTDLPSV